MGAWVLADLDQIIRDFMGQLQSATEQGWHLTKPDHYRSILAALESALNERRELLVSRALDSPDEPAMSLAEPPPAVPAWPVGLRWLLMRPFLCLIPSRRPGRQEGEAWRGLIGADTRSA
jgi:hypothetical protein